MAAMDETKLRQMCASINVKSGEYVRAVINGSKTLVSTFNENWVSNAAQSLAVEIKEVVDKLSDSIVATFTNMNDAISTSVTNFNNVEEESINYTGFTFTKPDFNAEVRSVLLMALMLILSLIQLIQ